MMSDRAVWETIRQYGVVPVIAIESVDAALPLADALLAGGLPVAEITFRTTAAADVIALLSKERPDLLVGAGTVLTRENVDAARDCGARFAVAPGLNPAIVNHAKEVGLPFVPGVCTPSDVEGALALGCTTQKFFPSEAMGGLSMIKALYGPYGHTGLQFVPTGGVNADNLEQYLSSPAVAAVGGTWIAKKPDMAEGHWAEVEARCKKVADVVSRCRK
jgi:2-dehydro-3-deoxyphosphogluconate aldolase / (4S)-4-hydroxy-2-oxoglutarate aldolase